MNNQNLGRLKKVDLRAAWSSEADHFTPWLARKENLELLGEAVGLDLELQAQEQEVGPFRADILCKDRGSDHWVLIENQLERTDHCHLGQLLTYAAGLNAVSIVWIAERFTDEHRAALDWLNENTGEGINFFGLEVELWQIGDSPMAPKFNVVSKPNEWVRRVERSSRGNEAREFWLRYWSEFVKGADMARISDGGLRACRQGNLDIPTQWRDFKLSAYVSCPEKRIGVYLLCRGESGVDNFRQLREKRNDVEKTLGASLVWQERAHINKGFVVWRLATNDPQEEKDWPRQHQLLAAKAIEFYRAFDPHIQELDTDAGSEA